MTKLDLLEFLAGAGSADATEVAKAFAAPYATAAMALLRLCRQGLVQRAVDPLSGTLWYRLTDRGWDRLRYFSD